MHKVLQREGIQRNKETTGKNLTKQQPSGAEQTRLSREAEGKPRVLLGTELRKPPFPEGESG